jgi:hypothetical protein
MAGATQQREWQELPKRFFVRVIAPDGGEDALEQDGLGFPELLHFLVHVGHCQKDRQAGSASGHPTARQPARRRAGG